MKFLELYINGFGKMQDVTLQLDAPLVVVYGHNEAGKSTLFQFIHTMLFGFSRKNQVNRFLEPVYGGSHGGSIVFITDKDEIYQLTRYREQHQGKAQLARAEKDNNNERYIPMATATIVEQANLERNFLSGINARLFQQLSAITLNELQATSVMTENELSQYLYHASWESGKQIAELEKQLVAEQDKLFKPRGQNQLLIQELKQYEQLQQQYKQVEMELEQYNTVQLELEQCDYRYADLQVQLTRQQNIVQMMNRAMSQREWWLEQQEVSWQLEQLQYVRGIPNGFSQHVDQIVASEQLISGEIRQMQVAEEQLELKITAINVNEDIITRAATVDHYLQLGSVIMEQQSQLAIRQDELQQLQQVIVELQQQLPNYWTKEQLRQLNPSAEQVTEYERLLSSMKHLQVEQQLLEQDQTKYDNELLTLDQQLLVTQNQIDQIEQELKTFRQSHRLLPQTRDELHEATIILDEAYRQYDYERMNVHATERIESPQSNTVRTSRSNGYSRVNRSQKNEFVSLRVIMLSAFSIILVIFTLLVSSKVLLEPWNIWLSPILIVMTLIAVLITGMEWSGSRNSKQYGNNERNDDQAEGMKGLYRALSLIVELSQPINESNYYDHRRELKEKIGNLQLLLQKREQLDQQVLVVEQQAQQLELAQHSIDNQLQQLQVQLEQVNEQWSHFSQKLQLPSQCECDHFSEILKLYRNIQHHYYNYDKQQMMIVQYEQQIDQYVDDVYGLTQAVWLQQLPEGSQQLQLSNMRSQIQIQKENLAERASLQLQLQQLHEQQRVKQQELQQLHNQLTQYYEQYQATTIGDLLAIVEHMKSYELWQVQYERLALQRKAGLTVEEVEALDHMFTQFDGDGIREKTIIEQQCLDDLRTEQQQIIEQRGRLLQQRERLVSSDEHQQLQLKKEAVISQIEVYVTQYMKLSLSKLLIKNTKEKYEQERQPAVLLKASQYFVKLTNGSYTQIIGNAELGTLQLRASNGALVESELLSRGTSELLYLCIRLAIHEAAVNHINLPLVLDDPCVNFDMVRLQAAMELLSEVSNERQLLYFTCHPHTRDQLQAVAGDTVSIQLDR
ncbi:AAA family ATPase [Paenibacillus endoradicis]|uniref:AAA family ATPase n=1 Tax=Paenibacillus endoradicis TaxID=2972487 RepID=UPI0021598913|nr:AAA family ATPase [Paenibacillus endoradicis]MCR8655886.1 AAA family ATPase [Paenibacillus endoradicis]MCR8658212.1 AAA family ATPase [Paenibacillus endoradicis]